MKSNASTFLPEVKQAPPTVLINRLQSSIELGPAIASLVVALLSVALGYEVTCRVGMAATRAVRKAGSGILITHGSDQTTRPLSVAFR